MKGGGFVSRDSFAVFVALLFCFVLPARSDAERGRSLVLVGESEPEYLEPRLETPPYSAILDDAHYALEGLGAHQDQRFSLGQTTREMLALFGPAPRTVFNEHNSMYCHVSSRPGDKTAVVFSLGAGGLWGVSVHRDRFAIIRAEKRCQATPVVSAAVRTPGGLRLGMASEEVVQLLGQPHRTLGRRHMGYASYRPVRPDEFPKDFPVSRVQRWIEVYIDEAGRVDGFFILANEVD